MNSGYNFDKVLREFGISAKHLASESGISENSISSFRKGRKSMTCDNLKVLLNCLPFEARQRFYSLELGASVAPSAISLRDSLRDALPQLDCSQKKELAMMIVESLAERESRSQVALVK
ncbi:helix-turn-helix domain-containing protein [Coleofasciculus sp.]|uniref:helix-turn-helix domain-containing protein n=1 Tax=Coleofasciculus sp. TaxID=3100458 RepID=UPI0039F77A40